MQRLEEIPAFCLPQKKGYPPRKSWVPPAQKLSRIKQRIGFALGNLKNGMEDG